MAFCPLISRAQCGLPVPPSVDVTEVESPDDDVIVDDTVVDDGITSEDNVSEDTIADDDMSVNLDEINSFFSLENDLNLKYIDAEDHYDSCYY